MIGRDGQTPEAAAMDGHNNKLSIALGKRARTWDEVKQGAQEIIDRSDRSGNGANGGAVWLRELEWSNHPKDRITGEELPREGWNWPDIDWIKGRVPNPLPYEYPYGGEEHRHEPAIDDELPLNLEDAAQMNPLSRPVASWSEDDRRVMASPPYLSPSHPARARAHAMVREWFGQVEGSGPVQGDATVRQVREPAGVATFAGGACEVPVRAHSRDGGEVEVGAHCRSRPAA